MNRGEDRALFEAIRYPVVADWHVRITWPNGRVSHWGPWKSRWAARHLLELLRTEPGLMAKHGDTGNGETCPLFPEHGNMYVLPESKPPRQYCPNAIHDGKPGAHGIPASRAFWPVFGFPESVLAYNARLEQAVRLAATPTDILNLDMEVLNGPK